jgi:hypothetical protein
MSNLKKYWELFHGGEVAAVGTNRSNDSDLEFSQGRMYAYLIVLYDHQDKQHKA